MALAASVLSAAAVSSVFATSWLILRNDLIDASMMRQASLREAHEDRISVQRAQADRIASLQMLDLQLMEDEAGDLQEGESQLSQYDGPLDTIINDAASLEGNIAISAPVADREFRASLPVAAEPAHELAGSSRFAFWSARDALTHDHSPASGVEQGFVAINQSLRGIERDHIARIVTLAQNAAQTAEAIAQALEDANLSVEAEYGRQSVGGPFVAAGQMMMYDDKVKELDEALKHLEAMKETARKYPIANPAPGRRLSSNFGVRRDPFNGLAAMHAGLDFPAPSGTPALATASGIVVRAGWSGGYGRMVEIKHANGFTTRYGHLSKIRVKAGQKISTGDTIGNIGSTGRSTGPHLHYEIRRHGKIVDPLSFLKAGRKVEKFL